MGDYALDGGRDPVAADATRWWLFLLMGIAAVVVGMVLLLDLVVAVETLALFVAAGLIFTGIGELAESGRYRTAWSMAAGVLLIASGILAAVWPGITLWALAVVAAVGLLFSGGLRIAAALMDEFEGRWWILAGGILSVVAGVLALAWPGATVLVLAILLGIRTLFFGLAEIAFALTLRQFSRA